MSETSAVLEAIKHTLKTRQMTYAELARGLGLSEASVKRMFSLETVTLKRVEEILAVLDITFLDLARLAERSREASVSQLTLEQERALAANGRLFSLFHLLLFGRSVSAILGTYEISREEVERGLRALERLALIERRPAGRVRLLVRRNVNWRPNGPLRQAYQAPVRRSFLEGAFDGERAVQRFANHRLAPASEASLVRKIERLMAEFDGLSELDTGGPAHETAVNGLYVAFRRFEFDGLVGLKKRRAP